MPRPIRFILALHNHQPIGNFEHVCEQAYQDSYLPFLDVFEPYEGLKIALHTSGSLMEWLDKAHPEYLDRIAALVAAGRIEIIGGAYYEPILAMLPSRDRIGQIESYTHWLESRLGADVRGMWVPERVWEQAYVRDLAAAKIEYSILDDFHFKNAGLKTEQLHGHYITEDDGRIIALFPGSEPMRYFIPFGKVNDIIDYLGRVSDEHENAVVVFGDDGEKFGTWPDTKHHVYANGWLNRFFDALSENQDWIKTTTPSEAIDSVRPVGKIYLPEGSYREMTEWALPAELQVEYHDLQHDFEEDGHWDRVKPFVRGGYWRNFKARYPESDEMYARMMQISRRLEKERGQIEAQSHNADYLHEQLDEAQRELYRGQCNCSYWHGAFGGIYLPHLRNAVFHHLIKADKLLNSVTSHDNGPWVEARHHDFNFDAYQEIELANDRMAAYFAPATGGQMYELDLWQIAHNLLATMTRRPEAYHQKVLAGENNNGNDECASIHDRVVFKQEGLDKCVHYDTYSRNSLVDLFYDQDVTPQQIRESTATLHGDFHNAPYSAKIKRNPGRIQVLLSRKGHAYGTPIEIQKAITAEAGSNTLEIAYRLIGIPQDWKLHFAVEMNFAGMPGSADDRFFHDTHGNRLGLLNHQLATQHMDSLGLTDEWLGLDCQLRMSRPTQFYTFPVESVSQSEGGFELVHQSVAVQPHWVVEPDADGCWGVQMHLSLDTSMAESRMPASEELLTSGMNG